MVDTIRGRGVKIRWDAFTAPRDVTKYEVRFGSVSPPTNIVNVTAPVAGGVVPQEVMLHDLDTAQVHYVQIYPYDHMGIGTPTGISSFTPLRQQTRDVEKEAITSDSISALDPATTISTADGEVVLTTLVFPEVAELQGISLTGKSNVEVPTGAQVEIRIREDSVTGTILDNSKVGTLAASPSILFAPTVLSLWIPAGGASGSKTFVLTAEHTNAGFSTLVQSRFMGNAKRR